MTTTTTTRDKDELKSIEQRISDLRDKRTSAVRERDSLRLAVEAGTIKAGTPAFIDAQNAVAKVGRIDDDLAHATVTQVDLLKRISGNNGAGSELDVLANASPPIPASKAWDTSSLLDDDDTRQRLVLMSASTMPVGRMHLGRLCDKDAFKADVTGTADMRRGTYYGVVPQLRRMLRILDLIPTGTMDGNSVPYTQESGSQTTALETAESSLKPEANVVFTDQDAFAKTIAHWTKIRKQVLSDFPAMATIIESRLRYGVERRLQDQILAGDGLGENLTGILNTTGIGAVTFAPPPAAAELIADQILTGITQVFLANAEANAIVMHPSDWGRALRAKTSGSGEYFSSGPFNVTPAVMWGVSLIPSASIPVGTALVGDFAIGASLFIRGGVNLLLSDADQNDFITNKITLLSEMRAALAVWQPSVFTKVALA